jgi:hypothetical protein
VPVNQGSGNVASHMSAFVHKNGRFSILVLLLLLTANMQEEIRICRYRDQGNEITEIVTFS